VKIGMRPDGEAEHYGRTMRVFVADRRPDGATLA